MLWGSGPQRESPAPSPSGSHTVCVSEEEKQRESICKKQFSPFLLGSYNSSENLGIHKSRGSRLSIAVGGGQISLQANGVKHQVPSQLLALQTVCPALLPCGEKGWLGHQQPMIRSFGCFPCWCSSQGSCNCLGKGKEEGRAPLQILTIGKVPPIGP